MRIGVVAGESSGDNLGAALIRALRERVPGAEFRGIAGPAMVEAGCEVLYRADELSVMGLVEVLGRLPRLFAVRRGIRRAMRDWRPDVFVGIDSPDFNLPLERSLRADGLRTVHYVSPTVWAWRPRRIHTVARAADRVLTLFPFEPAHYAGSGVDAVFVGHPLADRLSPQAYPQAPAREALGLPASGTVVAVLPGSRPGEVARLGPVFAAAVSRLAAGDASLRFIAPMVSDTLASAFSAALAREASGVAVELTAGGSRTAMAAADAVLTASGTAALEAMLLEKPMVVAYKLAPLTAWLLRTFDMLEIERFALPNLLAGGDVVPEFMQEAATPDALSAALAGVIAAPDAQRAAFGALRARLAGGGATAADAVLGLLDA